MAASSKSSVKKTNPNTGSPDKQELKTDIPMSEKDEVKKAESKMTKRVKDK